MHVLRTVCGVLIPLIAITLMTSACTTGKQHDMTSSTDTAVFLPVITDYTVDLFVEQVDGKPTKFGLFDQVTVDAGRREIGIRLEYQPAAGTSLAVGGIGNLLLRAGSNKTFRTNISVNVLGGHAYRLIARPEGDTLAIIVFDETDDREILKHAFGLQNGKFERLF